jgi:hypothetical protein
MQKKENLSDYGIYQPWEVDKNNIGIGKAGLLSIRFA